MDLLMEIPAQCLGPQFMHIIVQIQSLETMLQFKLIESQIHKAQDQLIHFCYTLK